MARDKSDQGKVVVVTGGTAGVGRAVARLFANHGASVALFSRGKERLSATQAELEKLEVPSLAVALDMSDADQVESAARKVEETLGPIDVWINNAMASVFSQVWDMKPEEYLRVTQVTYLGCVHGTLAALRRMRPEWNHKRVYRVYKAMKLNLRRTAKRRLPKRERVPLCVPRLPDKVWSMDFMSDALACGRRFRTFNVVDDFNREALHRGGPSNLNSRISG